MKCVGHKFAIFMEVQMIFFCFGIGLRCGIEVGFLCLFCRANVCTGKTILDSEAKTSKSLHRNPL